MWLFTIYGLFSVTVCTVDRTTGRPFDAPHVQVRARRRSHLAAMLKDYPRIVINGRGSAVPIPILDQVGSDYRWRIIVPRDRWAVVVQEMTEGLDYNNFKNSVRIAAKLPKAELNEYVSMLHNVWALGMDLQRSTTGGPDLFDLDDEGGR